MSENILPKKRKQFGYRILMNGTTIPYFLSSETEKKIETHTYIHINRFCQKSFFYKNTQKKQKKHKKNTKPWKTQKKT